MALIGRRAMSWKLWKFEVCYDYEAKIDEQSVSHVLSQKFKNEFPFVREPAAGADLLFARLIHFG